MTRERLEPEGILTERDTPIIDRLWMSAVIVCIVLGAAFFDEIDWKPGSLPAVLALSGLAYGWIRHALATTARGNRVWLSLLLTGADIVAVGAAIYISGGPASPFWPMFALPILAATLRFGLKVGLAATCAACGLSLVVLATGRFADGLTGLNLFRFVFMIAMFLLFSFFLGTLMEEEKRLRQEILALSRTDPLTGIYNHRYLLEVLRNELKKATRYDEPLAVGMIDLDLFKSVNDTFGHLAGDKILTELVDTLKRTFRATDCLARYGGDEIAVVMPKAGQHEALAALERARDAVARASFSGPNGQSLRITISTGAAVFPDHGEDALTLLDRADRAMYAAKSSGGNRVQLYDPSLAEMALEAASTLDSRVQPLSTTQEDFSAT
ncbi:MAG: GGDEF domain-containing protein [Firmicutes bacterium]|nr:GGDEF domain-containing protein [Bacillota bacterium]